MKKNVYLICTILGLIIPWSILISLFNAQEPIVSIFNFLLANAYSASFTADLVVSIIVFWFFVIHETQKLNMKNAWLYILASLTVGLSFTLPLFLFFRERQLESKP